MPKPSVTSTNHVLPYGELSPAQFERLCLWLVEYENWQDAEHYGEAGNEQGRDVIAYRVTSSSEPQLWYFQCKRYKDIGAAELKKEVAKIAAHIAAGEIPAPRGIVFVTNAVVSATTRKEVKEACHANSLACRFWARTELDLKVKKHAAIVKEFFNLPPQSVISNPQLAIVKVSLPAPLTPHLFGRADELRLLDEAWANPSTNLVVFHALGGAGKSALVCKWLAEMAKRNYDGARLVFGWSFFSQGSSENRSDSSEAFIDSALAFFGVTVEGDYFRKADRLAEALRAERTILILDGVEPLQYPPNSAGLPEGGLKDRALQTILTQLAAQQPGLCVITSRERLSDLNGYDEATVIQRALDHLPYATATGEQPCAQLLRALGATGDDDEMLAAAQEFQGHAYGLTLLGSYVAEVLGGDLRRRKDIANLFDDDRFGSKAEKMIAAYEKWLGDGVEVAILRMLGLFDRPAEAASIAALRTAPAIAGLTETLQGLSEVKWQQALSRLRRIHLLGSANVLGELDAHPLVREHFRQQLKTHATDAWRAGNLRLYEHLTRTAKEFPETLAEMQPLFAAVSHGCAAGKFAEALDAVYHRRINRGDLFFAVHRLGAFNALLLTLRNFFEESWQTPNSAFTMPAQSFLLSEVGFAFRAAGRLSEAIDIYRISLKLSVRQETLKGWENSCTSAHMISELLATQGRLQEAITAGRDGIIFAVKSEKNEYVRNNKAALAFVFLQAGQIDEASRMFEAAEKLLSESLPECPFLVSYSGFLFCEFLLDAKKTANVIVRSQLSLDFANFLRAPMQKALATLCLGKAHLQIALQNDVRHINSANKYLNLAVQEFRSANANDLFPFGLLARAKLFQALGRYEQAHRDLAEARAIAERGEMRLHLTDYHLESARLALAELVSTGSVSDLSLGEASDAQAAGRSRSPFRPADALRAKAREHYEAARKLIDETGYHRRDGELREIEYTLKTGI